MLTDDQIHYVQKRIRSYALKLKRLYAFQEEALEDLQQDLWADLLAALHSYDPHKGIWSHFVENVLRKRYCTMLKNRFRLKRPPRLRKVSLDACDSILAHVPAHLPLDVDLLHDRLFLQKQIRKMPRPLRTVFEQAQLYSFRQIAKNLSIPRHELRKLVDYGTAYLRAMQAGPACVDPHAGFLGRPLCASH